MKDGREQGVTAFVLAGGKSTRMGSDKAFLRLGGETLLSRALRVAGSVAGEVRIVGDAAKFKTWGLVVEDVYRDRGPLGGIHAALLSSTTELNLMLAVDLPFVEQKFLEFLLLQGRESGAMVTLARAGGGLQPLCALYLRSFADVAEQALRNDNNKIDPLFKRVTTCLIDEEDLAREGFSCEMFRNLNTPEELERVRSLSSEQNCK